MLRAASTGCHAPGCVAIDTEAVDGDAVAPSVTPNAFTVRDRPRSTVTLPVHWFAHQVVVALPSMALAAGEPEPSDVALAVLPAASATSTAGPGCAGAAVPRVADAAPGSDSAA